MNASFSHADFSRACSGSTANQSRIGYRLMRQPLEERHVTVARTQMT